LCLQRRKLCEKKKELVAAKKRTCGCAALYKPEKQNQNWCLQQRGSTGKKRIFACSSAALRAAAASCSALSEMTRTWTADNTSADAGCFS